MKELNLKFNVEEAKNSVENNGKVREDFVNDLRSAFCKPISNIDLRFKNSYQGRLVATVIVSYPTGTEQKFAGGVDVDLIQGIIKAMQNDLTLLNEYKASEHMVETPEFGTDEDLVLELFKQFIHSSMNRMITTDWQSNGERYRRVFFYPTLGRARSIKFCLPATEVVNSLIEKACLKKTEEEKVIENVLQDSDSESDTSFEL